MELYRRTGECVFQEKIVRCTMYDLRCTRALGLGGI